MSLLQEFYRDRVVFMTGATGFVGKVLLYKLLVACPDIRKILILLRSKKGKSSSERLCDLLSKPMFSDISKNILSKVCYISGDILEPGLGLSSEDHENLIKSDVSVVFHMAASVRFTDTLDVALRTNMLPALSLLNICQQIPHLQALVFVSTAFSNFPLKMINEEIYPLDVDLHQVSDIKELDMKHLDSISKAICAPNTYTFTKALAENGIQQNNTSLPVAIVRPSLVVNSWKEPAPGWTDNINGTITILVPTYLGLKRIILNDSKKMLEIFPVDMCVNSLLAVAWETAEHEKRGQCKVYNCVSSVWNPITWNQYWSVSGQQIIKYPSSKAQWYYIFVMTRFHYIFYILWICLELIPASFLFILHFFTSSGSKRSLEIAISLLKYNFTTLDFVMNDMRFKDSNLRDLLNKLTPEDHKIFNFDIKELNWNEFLTNHVKGIRQYLLKEDFDDLPSARKRYKRLYVMHCFVKVCIGYLCFRLAKSLYSKM